MFKITKLLIYFVKEWFAFGNQPIWSVWELGLWNPGNFFKKIWKPFLGLIYIYIYRTGVKYQKSFWNPDPGRSLKKTKARPTLVHTRCERERGFANLLRTDWLLQDGVSCGSMCGRMALPWQQMRGWRRCL
jgi:hypothetical protein